MGHHRALPTAGDRRVMTIKRPRRHLLNLLLLACAAAISAPAVAAPPVSDHEAAALAAIAPPPAAIDPPAFTDRAVLMAGAVVVLTAVVLLTWATGADLQTTMFEVLSAFGTVGLSTGLTATAPDAGKGILLAVMFIGRVGTITFATGLAIRQQKTLYRFPSERPIIG